jgi:type II secretory ATPase GspE/PulE/Tfp pilus assembly ATPase PilB-like protein
MIHYEGDTRRQFVRGEGCSQCYDTGFQGRLGIYELLTASRKLRAAISSGADLETIQALQHEQEETNLLAEGIQLAEAGKTSLEEIVRVAFFD